tara:strand:- start:780 stop:1619 length:840 start_codon:yes stop_codon:yes gene_type:complete
MKKKISLLLISFLIFSLGECLGFSKAKKEVKKGNLLYNKKDFNQALERYKEAFKDLPESGIVNFNLGSAYYKKKNYKKAAEHFEKALVSDDEALEGKAHYNSGNAKYMQAIEARDQGLTKAVNLLEESLHHYKQALSIDSSDEDAKYNFEFAKKELERLKKELESQKSKGNQNQENQEKSENQDSEQNQDKETKKQERKTSDKEQAKDQEENNQSLADSEKDKKSEDIQEADDINSSQGQMSKDQAIMLLESYAQEEEPKGLYQQKLIPKTDIKVLKDW